MKYLITGSAGHLGEAIMRTLKAQGDDVAGIDVKASPYTDMVGSIADRAFAERSLAGIDAVIHTATLHKPHVATHSYQDFVDTNITGTLNLLEAACEAGVSRFVFTSTTSTYGEAMVASEGAPALWIDEDVAPIPRNIYGVTKLAAENICRLFHRKQGLPCLILRTSRFFPEDDDSPSIREEFSSDNAKANEFLNRRVDLEDAVSAHLLAVERAPEIGFGRYVISATTPFSHDDLALLRTELELIVARKFPNFKQIYQENGWQMFDGIDRVYVNAKARADLGWKPKYDFGHILEQMENGTPIGSDLARKVGIKNYHAERFKVGPYPVE